MTRTAIGAGDKRGGLDATWAKIKFDRQIVAIAKAQRVTAIYTDDGDVRTMAAAEGISAIGLAELPLPPQNPQLVMQLEPPAEEEPIDAGHDQAEEDIPEADEPEEPSQPA